MPPLVTSHRAHVTPFRFDARTTRGFQSRPRSSGRSEARRDDGEGGADDRSAGVAKTPRDVSDVTRDRNPPTNVRGDRSNVGESRREYSHVSHSVRSIARSARSYRRWYTRAKIRSRRPGIGARITARRRPTPSPISLARTILRSSRNIRRGVSPRTFVPIEDSVARRRTGGRGGDNDDNRGWVVRGWRADRTQQVARIRLSRFDTRDNAADPARRLYATTIVRERNYVPRLYSDTPIKSRRETLAGRRDDGPRDVALRAPSFAYARV